MNHPVRSRLWVLIPVCALAFVGWLDLRRAQHVAAVTALGGWAERASSGANGLIVPEHIARSYHWLAQTQQMFDRHEWRVRQIDYENAPYGRAVATASPYRWWIGALAEIDHLASGRPRHTSVERAAVVADPLLHLMLLIGATLFIAWRFGALAATLVSLGIAVLFPFAAGFLPGAPDDAGVVAATSLLSLVMLAAAMMPAAADLRRRWFAIAGAVAGFGLWLNPAHEIAVLVGIGIGGVVAAWFRRTAAVSPAEAAPLPWRDWALSGTVVTLAAYLLEYSPGFLGGWQLRAVHPLYGIAWLGAGEILHQTTGWIERRRFEITWRSGLILGCGVIAVAALPLAMWKLHQRGLFTTDLPDFRMTKLPGSPSSPSFITWLNDSGASGLAVTLLLPLLIIVPATGLLLRRTTSAPARTLLALTLGPVVVTALVACRVLVWWADVDAMLLGLIVAVSVAAGSSRVGRFAWSGFAAAVCLPGMLQLGWSVGPASAPTRAEVFALIDRDMADWLGQHAPGGRAVFIAPPDETTALSYYGAGNGIATLSWQNKAGLEAAVRILSASTPEEAKALIDRRGITHLIMPSWDPYLDEYARMGMGELDGTFLNRVHQWRVPNWFRPVPYRLPVIGGFEQQSVTMFEVVEEQSDALALSRTAEYFIELGQLERAEAVGQALRRYPADMNAWIARAEVESAASDQADLAKSLNVLLPYVKAKRDRRLPWDLRVGLAVVLARAKEADLAREQVKRCVQEISDDKLRALPTGNLYRLLALGRAYDAPITDPKLHELALSLLPPDARRRLQGG